MLRTPMRSKLLVALVAVAALAGCGGNDDATNAAPTAPTAAAADLSPVKDYLLDHTSRLERDTAKLASQAAAYYRLAESVDFDYATLMAEHRDQVAAMVEQMQATYIDANPAYEEMEGVVAGVPSLADYDVIIDAGGDKSDPENAVPFSVKTPAGRTFEQPGNFFTLIESSVYGTEPRFVAKGVRPDLDGGGAVSFPEALPDADFLFAAATDFVKIAKELDAAARQWQPTLEDAFTAVVVMTPTMSEYFEAWKSSRFVAGDKADEKVFVATSRLSDIRDILGGLALIYDSIAPSVGKIDAANAHQTERSLDALRDFAQRLFDEERAGRQ